MIVVPQPRPTSDVPYHHDRAPGQKYLLLDRSVYAQSPIYVALRRVDHVPADQPRWLDPHGHTCNSFYVFLGDEDDLSGLAGEVELGGERFRVDAPAAVLIPPLVLHHYRLTGGSGWYLQITLAPTYEESLAEPDAWQAELHDAARLHRRPDGPRLIDGPGVEVSVAEPPLEPPPSFALDVALSRGGAPASVTVGGERLATPVAVLTDHGRPQLEPAAGRPLVVRILPSEGG